MDAMLVFAIAVLAVLALDLGIWHRTSRVVGAREAALWTGVWIVLALAFAGGLALTRGTPDALAFLTGYVIEASLSVDNVFVIALIFGICGIPQALQHRALFWGIIGVLVMRGSLIAVGATALARFPALGYVIGALLLVAAVRMLMRRGEPVPAGETVAMRVLPRILPVQRTLDGQRFFTRDPEHGNRWTATPLLVALVSIEAADLAFAMDSIPATFAVTRDPFLVFTSNLFAVLGLRSLYALLASAIGRFRYLPIALAVVLAFVGIKMLLEHTMPISTPVTLGVVAAILGVGMIASR